MNHKILVAYASGSGSTGEVAEVIGQVLSQAEVFVEVKLVQEVASVTGYDSVVIGSSIRVGRWLPEAYKFVEAHEAALSQRPVAYFTTCLTMVNDTEDNRKTVLTYMEPLFQKAPQIDPVGLGLFAGSLDPGRRAILPGDLYPQGDYRNWEAIKAWAAEIRPALLAEAAQTAPVTETVLGYSDMSGTDLSHAVLARADLRDTKLRNVNLRAAELNEADLIEADLRKADLHQASLGWAEMHSANLEQANLSEANLIGARLDQANLSRANLYQATLNGANLSRANLSRANLTQADLNWADLRSADLSDANLSEANLAWANLSKANLSRTDLTRARYNAQTQWPENFSAADHGALAIRVQPY